MDSDYSKTEKKTNLQDLVGAVALVEHIPGNVVALHRCFLKFSFKLFFKQK